MRALGGEGWRERQDLLANTSRQSLQVTSLPVGLYIKITSLELIGKEKNQRVNSS